MGPTNKGNGRERRCRRYELAGENDIVADGSRRDFPKWNSRLVV